LQILEQHLNIDLVLLDIIMPGGIDGFETLKRIHCHPKSKEIKVIMLTSASEADDVTKAFELGAVDYVTKPFRMPELKARVETHIKLKHGEQELKRTNLFMEKVFQLTPARISIYNLETTQIEYTNVQDPEFVPGMSFNDYNSTSFIDRFRKNVHPEDQEIILDLPQRLLLLTDNEPFYIEFRRLGKDRTYHWYRTYFAIFERNPRGIIYKVLAINIDITQQKELELALQEAHNVLEERVRERTAELEKSNLDLKSEIEKHQSTNAYLQATLNSNQQAFILLDTGQKLLAHNRVFAEMVQRFLRREIREDDDIFTLISEKAHPVFDPTFARALNGETIEFELPMTWQSSLTRWYLICFTPSLTEDEHKVMGVCISMLDITQQKRSEQKLQNERLLLKQDFEANTSRLKETNVELTRINHAREEFLAKLSLELCSLPNLLSTLINSISAEQLSSVTPNLETLKESEKRLSKDSNRLLEMIRNGLREDLNSHNFYISSLALHSPWNSDNQSNPIATDQSKDPQPDEAQPIILIAEDNEIFMAVLSEVFKKRRYQVVEARTGKEAIDRMEGQLINAILMDIEMPEMDGVQAIRQLRSSGYSQTPIIALLDEIIPSDLERCLEAGANKCITKFIDPELLFKTTSALIT
jgi:CheY-like chemotaxis protein